MAAIEVTVGSAREDTVGRTTLLATTPRLVFPCMPYAVKALAAAGRMLNLAAPLLSCAFDWRVWITGGFVVIGLLIVPVPDPRVDIRIASFFNASSALFAAAFLAICEAS